jgi:hypothetical protein
MKVWAVSATAVKRTDEHEEEEALHFVNFAFFCVAATETEARAQAFDRAMKKLPVEDWHTHNISLVGASVDSLVASCRELGDEAIPERG